MKSNKDKGTQFENEFASILSRHGFWVHLFQDNKNGQPCDVVAARNGRTHLFDCKDCEGEMFRLSRMEENQINAMQLFEMTGNSRGMFAVRFPGNRIYLVAYWELKALRDNGVKSISSEECRTRGTELERWLRYRDETEDWSDEDACHDWQ